MKIRADTMIGIVVIVLVFLAAGIFQQWELNAFY